MAAANSSSAPNGPLPPPKHEPSTHKKTGPLPWSHMETVHLIEAYQEKWYSLKRGQLKASQWEEVSITVAVRCGYDDEPSKTSTQCRHKMEKLRQRYRIEKQRLSPFLWPYFNLMDRMELGPFPIAAAACPIDVDDDDEDNNDEETNKSRSINHILRRPSHYLPPQWSDGGGVGRLPRVSRFLRNPMFRKRKSFEMDEVEEEEEQQGGVDPISELASVIRAFGEGYIRIENTKMEMMKETERYRMEMETKRTEMILASQSRIIDAIAKSFAYHKSNKT